MASPSRPHGRWARWGVLIVSGTIAGQTETSTLFILRAFDEGHDAPGYVVALTLAMVSILMLSGIEIFKRRQEKGRGA